MKRCLHTIAMLILGTWISGCAVLQPPQFEVSSSVPSSPLQWTSAEIDTNSVSPWLADFEDEQLVSLVTEALASNHDLAATQARMEAAYARTTIAAADLLPTVGLNTGASRTQRTSSSGFQITNSRNTNYSTDLQIAWEADLWGRLRHRKNAAVSDFFSVQANFEAARLSLAARVSKLWYSAIESKLQIELAERTVASFENSLRSIEAGHRGGVRSALDVHLARANVHNAEDVLMRRKAVSDDAVRSVEVILGRYPRGDIALASTLPTLVRPVPVGAPAALLMRRPDLIAAENALDAALERRRDESRNYLPDIRLTGSGGLSGSELRNLTNWNFLVWSIAGAIAQPLFSGGRLAGRRAEARAAHEEAIAEYAAVVLQAFREVESALTLGTYLTRREGALMKRLAELEQAQSLALERYEKGLENVDTMLSTQRQRFDAESNLLSVMNLKLQNRLDLYLALGGAFSDSSAGVASNKEYQR